MMNNIFKIFITITFASLILLTVVIYNDVSFQNNPLSPEIQNRLVKQNDIIKRNIHNTYGIDFNIPIVISDKLKANLFGLASYRNGEIKITLNKKRFQENDNYMIDYVLAHEYAHALMFHFGKFTRNNGGHTKQWQNICFSIGGKKCDRFVGHDDILIEKIGVVY